MPWRVEHSIEIERPPEEVFAFVADPRNDATWCDHVSRCVQSHGDGPGPGARYEETHRPSRLLREQTRRIEVLEHDSPHLLRTRQEDGNGVFLIDYVLESTPRGTRWTQRDAIEWKVSRAGQAVARRMVSHHIGEQAEKLKRVLEQRAGG
jgi:uncharacterized protein YndB with AHSA1/START domain